MNNFWAGLRLSNLFPFALAIILLKVDFKFFKRTIFQISVCQGTWQSVGIYHLYLFNEGIPPTGEVKEQWKLGSGWLLSGETEK